jgi:hypothetical protein
MMGDDPLTSLLYVPLACAAYRCAADWLLLPLLRATIAPPLLWLWRAMLWQPRWWLSWPAAAACFYIAHAQPDQDEGTRMEWFTAAASAASWCGTHLSACAAA